MRVIRLVESKSVEEHTQVLYEALRAGDHQNLEAIYVAKPVGDDLAVAIRDSLLRVASLK